METREGECYINKLETTSTELLPFMVVVNAFKGAASLQAAVADRGPP